MESGNLPVVHGRNMNVSLADFERACFVHIDQLLIQIDRHPTVESMSMVTLFNKAIWIAREQSLPFVHGRKCSINICDFNRECLVQIGRLRDGLGPYDSAMMATLCDAVRMVREYSEAMLFPAANAGLEARDARAGDNA